MLVRLQLLFVLFDISSVWASIDDDDGGHTDVVALTPARVPSARGVGVVCSGHQGELRTDLRPCIFAEFRFHNLN